MPRIVHGVSLNSLSLSKPRCRRHARNSPENKIHPPTRAAPSAQILHPVRLCLAPSDGLSVYVNSRSGPSLDAPSPSTSPTAAQVSSPPPESSLERTASRARSTPGHVSLKSL